MSKPYVGNSSLSFLISLIKTAITGKVSISDIVDNLTDGGDKKVLSAEQGKLLNKKVDDFMATKGKANGLAPLESDGLISSEYLPSYVDDVIEGYYLEEAFYTEDSTSSSKILGETGKIYVDLNGTGTYRYSGSVFVKITSSDMTEMTDEEVENIWDEVMNEE